MRELPEVEGVEHEWVDAAGVRLHVATAGPDGGRVVVLLHGWPQHWWLWREQLPALAAAGLRVLAFDLRGFGWSDVPAAGYDKPQFATDVLAALDALGVHRFSVAGHDWGGWTAQLIAQRAPERVERLAVLNIAPVAGDPKRALPNAWRLGYQLPLAAPVLGAALQARFGDRFLPGVDAAARAVYAAPLREPERARAGSLVYRDFLRRDMPGGLRGAHATPIGVPTLVIHGKDDPVVRPAMVEGFRDLAADVRIEFVDGAGHFVVDEQPARVTELLLEHFGGGA